MFILCIVIPHQIGYYHVCGIDPSVLEGTPFSDLKGVYEGAWSRISRAIDTAAEYGIGVLIGTSQLLKTTLSCINVHAHAYP